MSNELSAEDLRSRLYHSLREKGLVDALKSQLRNKLITELRDVGITHAEPHEEPTYSTDGSLLHKAANSLVADHLRRCHYDYSLSVFMPETGGSIDKVFTTRDLLQLLNISPHSKLYQTLIAHNGYHKKGFLWQLLCEIASQHGFSSQTTGIQTDPIALPPMRSLEEELRKVETRYENINEEWKKGDFVEERILAYQRQLDERSRTDVQLECARFKENELARAKVEIRDKFRREQEVARREMERTYQSKLEHLSERDRNSSERLQKQQEMHDKEIYNQRQTLLEEMEVVRTKEGNLRRQQEVNKREHDLWEEKMKTRELLVKQREDTVRKQEIEFDGKLRAEMNQFKMEQKAEYMEIRAGLEMRESRVKDDERRLHDGLFEVSQVQDELKEKRRKCNELEAELIKVNHDLLKARSDSDRLHEKSREMANFDILKEENAVLRNELENFKMRFAELQRDYMVERQKHEEVLREMTHYVSKPTPEVYLLQKEVEKMRNQLHQEQIVSHHVRYQQDTRIKEEIERNTDLLKRYEQQTMNQKEMNREVTDLRGRLHDTTNALTNEVYRRAAPTDLSRESSLCDHDMTEPGLVDPNLIRNAAEPGQLFSANAPHHIVSEMSAQGEMPSTSEDYSYSSDLVKETKYRLRSLEKEAANLEKNYRSFQFRITNIEPVEETYVRASERTRVNISHSTESDKKNRSLGFNTSAGRPLSSTPSKAAGVASRNVYSPIDHVESRLQPERPLLDASVSTVRSESPAEIQRPLERTPVDRRSRPMSVNDLQARPGSPNVVVLEDSHDPHRHKRVSPSGEENKSTSDKTEIAVPTISLDDAWKKPSLDGDWKRKQEEEERRRKQEEEDREYEEQRRLRELERQRREEEAWEREQEALRQLEGKSATESLDTKKSPSEDKKDEPAIDPVMQKYMEMVQQQKHREKEVTKKAVDTWNKGKQPQENTPSVSDDILTEEESRSNGGGASDDNFW